jgi:DeoR/GlpR family transcriptional regulator of sugar metabolism
MFANTGIFNYHHLFELQHRMDSTKTPAQLSPGSLTKKARKQLIMQQVNIHTRIAYSELVNQINVSEDTIRRDVNELAEDGKVVKIKGGAMSAAYHYGQESQTYAQQNKLAIAEKTLQLLRNDMIVLIGGGTTIREFIRKIPPALRATFITVNVLSAVELLDKPMIKTIVIGGQISAYSQMTVSGEVFEYLSNINADLCIIGTNAIDPENGLTDADWETIQVKKAMIKAAEKVAILAISEKLNSSMKMKIADLRDIDYLITELPANSPELEEYRAKNVTVL